MDIKLYVILIPMCSNMSDAEFSRASRNQRQNKVVLKEGFQTDLWDVSTTTCVMQ